MAEPRLAEGIDLDFLNARGAGHLPGWFGFEAVTLEPGRMGSRMLIRSEMLAPNGYLHAATIIAIVALLFSSSPSAVIPTESVSSVTRETGPCSATNSRR